MVTPPEPEFSDEDLAFISRFDPAADEDEDYDEEDEVYDYRPLTLWGKAFWGLIALILVLPFGISGYFLYALSHYKEIRELEGVDLLNTMAEENKEFGSLTGVKDLQFIMGLYDDRWKWVAVIFTVCLTIAALLIAIRGVYTYLRKR